MYRLLTNEEKKQIRTRYAKDNLFRLLFKAMFTNDTQVLSPEDVWCEARKCVLQIGEADEDTRDMEAMALWGELLIRYDNIAEDSATRVMLATFLMLLDKYPSIEGHPFREVCIELKKLLRSMPNFFELYGKCHLEEDRMEEEGRFIDVVDYLETFLADTADKSMEKSDDEIILWFNNFLHTAKSLDTNEMRYIEILASRFNDKNGHRFQKSIDNFRDYIDQQVANQNMPTEINTQGGPAIMGGDFNATQIISHKQLESK